jgi:hypothetical protein
MVAPLDNIRPIEPGLGAGTLRPRRAENADFAAELQRATEQLRADSPTATPAAPFDADPLIEIQQATQAMQRASSFASAARAYYRAAQQAE